MKTTLFTAGQVMACLMLLSPGAFAEEYHKDVSAVFHLKAMYKNVTCNQALTADGNSSGTTTIDFGTFSSDSKDITKKVVLTLTCDSDLPDTVKVGFSVLSPAKVDADNNSQLYPSDKDGKQQTNLYYDWVWGKDINNTVKQSVDDSAHKTVKPNDGVDLSGASSADVYEIVPQSNGGKSLNFPLDITRKVKETSQLAAGDYTANVTVTISYD
ncbi:hypothetical protein FPC62_19595 [Salmonella enterica]|uniref:Fimbrial protein n=1 Tax=Salmonella enterica TaxID=28901 RepID=A0A5T8BI32_SALER|nr:hypothetical protein [Salmonella enterica]EBN4403373.1 hypothetical protein [Salmonella enterica]EBU0748167.1 hypothetical protein [Salmonella enterica]ECH3816244.1 hypothetical protein [Salmonella enterica]EGC1083172.1 hypothetical protein [Salmonella enterica]